ncbi:hypothetical protein BI081_gp025 [Mycobacterium phage Tonenili]|uniref:Uncharacterized protein n=1 Tax=Mycobacterium phage Tonenili TaxID=1891703 RepID=A0A1C9EH30_9CAUD|nr:hypothetical protein BI081_gp025 [Mycobacterium phage Tonenili]AON96776.1 hypothetical protein SEA_TONENILI_25 [Mycobacterium phage Tonenili]
MRTSDFRDDPRAEIYGPLWEAMAAQGVGPHIVTAKDGRAALCGGPGACYVCGKEA